MNTEPKIGMYVSYSVFNDDYSVSVYGIVDGVSEEDKTVRVVLYDFSDTNELGKYYGETNKVKWSDLYRVPARFDAKVKYDKKPVKILPSSPNMDKDGFYYYFIEYQIGKSIICKRVCESKLCISMDGGMTHVAESFCNASFTDPRLYICREIIGKNQSKVRTAPEGFSAILGSRSNLYSHQLDSIVQAFEEEPCHLMLADEVGLGKTIEACSIIKGMRDKKPDLRVMVIVPDQLQQQWYFELTNKFDIPARICPTIFPLTNPGVFIVPFGAVQENWHEREFIHSIIDLCILDEGHKIVRKPKLYKSILFLLRLAPNRLVLTATPVSQENEDYKKLLSLIEPEKFEQMPTEKFMDLAHKQNETRARVFKMMHDLPDYSIFDLTDDYISGLTQIQKSLNDKEIAEAVTILKSDADQATKIDTVKDVLAYIAENYRIDSNIIRHRKMALAEMDAKRTLKEIPYEPAGAAEGFYEQNCFDVLNSKLEEVFSREHNIKLIQMCKLFMQLTTSSPYAVYGNVKGIDAVAGDPLLSQYLDYLGRWKKAFDWEIENISYLTVNSERFHSKLAKIIEWITKEDSIGSKKFLVFSDFPQTAEKYAEAFQRFFGAESTKLFYKDMTGSEMRDAVDAFQNDDACRFIVSDGVGGIGRNFQMAEYIIHCDLPWSPAVLEQRIGRLDRIGREKNKDIISVVIHADYGTEQDLFDFYNKGLSVFTKSLCGMEISFDDIEKLINKAFVENPMHGLKRIIPRVKQIAEDTDEQIDQELYYDMARRLDPVEAKQVDRLTNYYQINNDDLQPQAITTWAKIVGFEQIDSKPIGDGNAQMVCFQRTGLNYNAMKRMGYLNPMKKEQDSVLGTFSRKAAVQHEKLTYLAPKTTFFDSIAHNAESSNVGSVTSVFVKEAGVSWEGAVLTWNIDYNARSLAEEMISSDALSDLLRFLQEGQVQTFISLADFSACEDPLVLKAYQNLLVPNQKTVSWASNTEQIQQLSAYLGDVEWKTVAEKIIDLGRAEALLKTKEILDLENARDYLQNKYISLKFKEKAMGAFKSTAQFTKSAYLRVNINNLYLHSICAIKM